jgi:hypothetical protein
MLLPFMSHGPPCMTGALLHIRVFLNVFAEALALTPVTTYHPPLSPQTLLLANRESKQSHERTEVPSCLCLEAVIKNLHETYRCRMYSGRVLMMGRGDARNM